MTLKLGFKGNNVPKFVIIENVRVQVDVYIPPLRQCFNCGRIGHSAQACRSKARCLKCGGEACPPCGPTKCVLCGSTQHNAKDRDKCHVWNKENQINMIKSLKKMPRKQVVETYFANDSNRFSSLLVDDDEFPTLGAGGTQVHSVDQEANRVLVPRKYSQVAKQKLIKKKLYEFHSNASVNQPSSTNIMNYGLQNGPSQESPRIVGRRRLNNLPNDDLSNFTSLVNDLFSIVTKICSGNDVHSFSHEQSVIKDKLNKMGTDRDLLLINSSSKHFQSINENSTI